LCEGFLQRMQQYTQTAPITRMHNAPITTAAAIPIAWTVLRVEGIVGSVLDALIDTIMVQVEVDTEVIVIITGISILVVTVGDVVRVSDEAEGPIVDDSIDVLLARWVIMDLGV